MNKMLTPTDIMLVGLAFLLFCLCLQLGAAEPTKAIFPESLDKIKDFHNQFTSPSYASIGQGRSKLPEMAEASRLADEKVFMNGSSQLLDGLISVNGGKHRSVAYDGLLESTNSKINAMDISINGNGQRPSKENNWTDIGTDNGGIENMVDNAMVSKQHSDPVNYQSCTGSPEQQRLGNFMNIVVSGIDVRATNTVEGGSAVATSNIIIKPVQIINCPPEVEEKLK